MALVYAVAQQKGGAGKTTLAANLAAVWAASKRVALVDIDPQKSLTRWHALRAARRPAVPTIELADIAGWRLAFEVGRLGETHDVILIDTPAQLDLGVRLAVRGADLVLLPMQPSAPDLWATAGTAALAAEEKRPLLVILNRVAAGRGESAEQLRRQIDAELAAGDHRVAAATLGNRIGFATAFAAGSGVTEAAPRSLAAREALALRDEIDRHPPARG